MVTLLEFRLGIRAQVSAAQHPHWEIDTIIAWKELGGCYPPRAQLHTGVVNLDNLVSADFGL